MPSRTFARIASLVALVMLTSCKKEEVVEVEPPPRPIKIYRLDGQVGDTRPDYPGRIKSRKVVELAFEVEGRITDWNVEEGQKVKKGQILSRLDPRDYQAQAEVARARLRLAEAEYRRESKLFASGSGTQRDLDVAIRSRDVSRAELRISQKAFEDTKLRAIFDGVIARKLVTDFRNVAAREPVLLLQDESAMEVIVDVPERDLTSERTDELDLAKWNEKAKPMAELSALPGRQFPVRLSELATAADPNTRTFRATFVMKKPDNVGVLSGMTAKLVLTGLATTAPDDFLVPAQAVVADTEKKPFVWLVDDESMTVSKRPIEVGKITSDRIVVTEGLEGGEAIAMTGVHLLTEGQEVTEMEQSDETRR
ncbi:MAG: efflux RND transporter periplasmic adaptor subunit [Deltaproteobacteria bacterium]|nr:efflux RND transporter periplasmic adaptor subunit [Deltaproteobacteria bacterium]